VNTDNGDGAGLVEDSSEEDDISALLRDLACGLDDRGDFEDNSSADDLVIFLWPFSLCS
jgi:hypothetical protein